MNGTVDGIGRLRPSMALVLIFHRINDFCFFISYMSTRKLRRIMEELLSTEREYVKALGYVRDHYFPELERADVPQDLRGQRGSIFGNLEKLHDFHQHHFLNELESCVNEPFRVGRCFLRHVGEMHVSDNSNVLNVSHSLLCKFGAKTALAMWLLLAACLLSTAKETIRIPEIP